MRLLVTGGCGFIGSHFINRVATDKNCEVLVNVDAMYYCASTDNVRAEVRQMEKYTFVKGNITSGDLVAYLLWSNAITHVVHFAAQSHVQNSFDDSEQFVRDNVLGTNILLERCRQYGKLEKFVHVSTDEVYGETGSDKKDEQSLLCPTNPYAATKAAAELIARSYLHSYSLPVVVTRGNNVYGPRQYPEKLIPRFISQALDGRPLTIQGDGSAQRAFLHVEDTVAAFELILREGEIGGTYNIGCDDGMEFTVKQVAAMVNSACGMPCTNIVHIADRPFNDKRYYICNKKLKALGWRINRKFDEGLYDLIDRCRKDFAG